MMKQAEKQDLGTRPQPIDIVAGAPFHSQIMKVEQWLKAQGFVNEMNPELKKPTELPPPAEQPRSEIPVEPLYIPTDELSGKELVEAIARNKERKELFDSSSKHFFELSAHYHRLRTEYTANVEQVKTYRSRHEQAVSIFADFVPKARIRDIRDHQEYKVEPTLYKALELCKRLYKNDNFAGVQTLHWLQDFWHLVPKGETVQAYNQFVQDLKDWLQRSSVLADDVEKIDDKKLVVPFILTQLIMGGILRSLPKTTAPLATRFTIFRNKLETEGATYYKTPQAVIEDLSVVLRNIESSHDKNVTVKSLKANPGTQADSNGNQEKGAALAFKTCPIHPKAVDHHLHECFEAKRLIDQGKMNEWYELINRATYDVVKANRRSSHSQRGRSKSRPPNKRTREDGEDEKQDRGRPRIKIVEHQDTLRATQSDKTEGEHRRKIHQVAKATGRITRTDPNTPSTERESLTNSMTTSTFDWIKHQVFEVKGVRSKGQDNFLIDTGASLIMSPDITLFDTATLMPSKYDFVYLGDDTAIPVEASGTLHLPLGKTKIQVRNALYVPKLVDTLVSLTHLLQDSDDLVVFSQDTVYIYLRDRNQVIQIGKRLGRLYYLNQIDYESDDQASIAALTVHKRSRRRNYDLWHAILGHASEEAICRTLDHAGISYDFRNDPYRACALCQMTNFRRKTVTQSSKQPTRPLHTLHEDHFPTVGETWYRHKYCVFLICTYSHYGWVTWARKKDDIPQLLFQLIGDIETDFNQPVVLLRGDRGELNWTAIQEFCENHKPHRIRLKLSPADTQDFNGAAERPIGIIRARAAAMLMQANLPSRMFNFAMDYAITISNALVHTETKKTPFEMLHGMKEDYSRFHPFGCLVAIYVPKKHRPARAEKLRKAEPGLFLGYRGSKILLVYKFRTRAVHEEYQVRFLEHIFPGLTLNPAILSPFVKSNFLMPDEIPGVDTTGDSSEIYQDKDEDKPFLAQDENREEEDMFQGMVSRRNEPENGNRQILVI